MTRINHSITVGPSRALGSCNYCKRSNRFVIEITMAPSLGFRACKDCAENVADLLERFAARARDFSSLPRQAEDDGEQ